MLLDYALYRFKQDGGLNGLNPRFTYVDTRKMFISILKIIIVATILGLPLAIINAYCFHGKKSKEANDLASRVLFTLVGAFVFSLMITYLTLTLKDEQDSLGWLYYAVGLFFCIPYHLKSNLKENRDLDHFMDGMGIFASVVAYGVTVAFWSSFFSDPFKAGFLHEFSSAIKNIAN